MGEKDQAGDNGGTSTTTAGLFVDSTDAMRSFLSFASEADSSDLSPEIRSLASDLSSQCSISYRSLRDIWSACPSSKRPPLADLFSGAGFVFSSPKRREKSEDLKERLKKLADLAERKAYRELVKDVAPKEEVAEPFSSYKDQMGFGLHVVLIMFTGYLVGFATFRALFSHSAAMSAAGGILGLVCGMLLETVLFILRTTSRDSSSSHTTSKMKKQQ